MNQSPFDNPILIPCLDPETGTAFWLGHGGQGAYDAIAMRDEHLAEFQRLIVAGELIPGDIPRYEYSAQRRLIRYRCAG